MKILTPGHRGSGHQVALNDLTSNGILASLSSFPSDSVDGVTEELQTVMRPRRPTSNFDVFANNAELRKIEENAQHHHIPGVKLAYLRFSMSVALRPVLL